MVITYYFLVPTIKVEISYFNIEVQNIFRKEIFYYGKYSKI